MGEDLEERPSVRPYKNMFRKELIQQNEKGTLYMRLFTFMSGGQKVRGKRKGVLKKIG